MNRIMHRGNRISGPNGPVAIVCKPIGYQPDLENESYTVSLKYVGVTCPECLKIAQGAPPHPGTTK